MQNNLIHLVECPRDAMQGWKHFIPTQQKIDYLNALLQVGFDTIDFGSFVSAKAIPQLADTHEVISGLDLAGSTTQLLAIAANARGAATAAGFAAISCIGYPFSISETFQQRNANSSITESLHRVEEIQEICRKQSKQLVIYISMGFGNPYGDDYSAEIVFSWVNKLVALGITIISLADTVGLATAGQVAHLTGYLVQALPGITIGVHLHAAPGHQEEKIDAALQSGCIRFDGALKGIGGCPMAGDQLVGNMNTELMIAHFRKLGVLKPINESALQHSLELANSIFN